MSQPPPPPVPDAAAGPAGPGAAPAPGTDLSSDIGAAARFAGRALLRSPGALLGAGAVYGLAMILLLTGTFVAGVVLMIAAVESGGNPGGELTGGQLLLLLAVSVVVVLVSVPVAMLWEAGAARAGGILLSGGRPTFGQALLGPGRVIATALLVMALVTIGSILLYLPGLVAGVLLSYAIPASVRGASPLEACKESVGLARAHLGTTIVGFLVVMLASYVAGMVVIGVLASVPFMVLFQLGLYERVNGRALPDLA